MNNTKHTPGPWVVTEHSSGMICVAGPDHKDLCAVGYNKTEGRDDAANATLIAAAPALYEALAQAIEELADYEATRNDPKSMTRYRCEAALAQAEGAHK